MERWVAGWMEGRVDGWTYKWTPGRLLKVPSFASAQHAITRTFVATTSIEMKHVDNDSMADAKVLYIVLSTFYTLLPHVDQTSTTAHGLRIAIATGHIDILSCLMAAA